MKRLAAVITAVTVLFATVAVIWLTVVPNIEQSRIRERSINVNRLNNELTKAIENGIEPDTAVNELLSYDIEPMPDSISYISASEDHRSIFTATGKGGDMICIVNVNGSLKGFAEYHFNDPVKFLSNIFVLTALIICWFASVILILAVYYRILRPFKRFSDYPEHLAKIPDAEKLPETKDRRFGRFVWSLNMLGDVLRSERRRSERLECQRQTLLASIAHGIKTPVTNIRLCSEAIRTGLYSDKESCAAELAEKIDSNAQKIQVLIKELIDTSTTSVSSYVPEVSQFYLSELSSIIVREYSQRMELSRIPFNVECQSNRMITSDLYGIVRIISQLIENAFKYGNGQGIAVLLSSDDEGLCINVRNKGELLSEDELPFIFDSFRRGSNSHGIEGSGIGLFTAKSIASSLGGTICVRRLEETSEMEFTVFISD